jgi:hypothetical protein
MMQDPRVDSCTVLDNNPETLHLVMTNVWKEAFDIRAVLLPDGSLAAHATRI